MVLPVDVSALLYCSDFPFTYLCIDIQEIYGEHYALPELGPLGGHGLANPRDFQSPLASFDIDQNPWKSASVSILWKAFVLTIPSLLQLYISTLHLYLGGTRLTFNVNCRVCGQLHECSQEHTPFDVVAWQGKCVLSIAEPFLV